MAHPGKHSGEGSEPKSIPTQSSRSSEQSQLDFEIEFYGSILERQPDYVDVLRVMGNNLTLKGRYAQGLQIDKRLVQLRPNDPLAHYNLACSYALPNRTEQALKILRRAVEAGISGLHFCAKTTTSTASATILVSAIAAGVREPLRANRRPRQET